jgi:S-DNA-T family DNA segregation ATPase FtsK/SpoIIIE
MQAVEIVLNEHKASTSLLQRRLSIGYNKAANLMEDLEGAGVVGPANGSKPREILISSIEEIES